MGEWKKSCLWSWVNLGPSPDVDISVMSPWAVLYSSGSHLSHPWDGAIVPVYSIHLRNVGKWLRRALPSEAPIWWVSKHSRQALGSVIKNAPAMQEARVWSLSWEDPTCHGAGKPVHRKCWARARSGTRALQPLKPERPRSCAPKPEGKPPPREACTPPLEKKPRGNKDPAQAN